MLESQIESRVCKWARKNDIVPIKLGSLGGETGWPDRMFAHRSKVIFIEFKRPGNSSTDKQIAQQDRLARQGFTVYRDIDNVEIAKAILKRDLLNG